MQVGRPVIRGTRLVVEFVLGLIAQGWPEQDIMQNYRLSTDQVRTCVAYAQERLQGVILFRISWPSVAAVAERVASVLESRSDWAGQVHRHD